MFGQYLYVAIPQKPLQEENHTCTELNRQEVLNSFIYSFQNYYVL